MLARLCGWDHSTAWRKLTGKSPITQRDELAIRSLLTPIKRDRAPFRSAYGAFSRLKTNVFVDVNPYCVGAGELGFEPRLTDPESVVLPLHHSPRRDKGIVHSPARTDNCRSTSRSCRLRRPGCGSGWPDLSRQRFHNGSTRRQF